MRLGTLATFEFAGCEWKSDNCWGVVWGKTRTFMLTLVIVMGRLKQCNFIQASLSFLFSLPFLLSLVIYFFKLIIFFSTCNLFWKEEAQLREPENTCKLLILVDHRRADSCMIQQVVPKYMKIQQHRYQEKSSPKSQDPVWVCARG